MPDKTQPQPQAWNWQKWLTRAVFVLLPALVMIAVLIQAIHDASSSSTPSTHSMPTPVAHTATVHLNVTWPVPPSPVLDVQKVSLGHRLFHDVRLSRDDTVSCASCHALSAGGVDNRVHSVGVAGSVGDINAPTVLNSGLNFVQFWDGRALTLEAQIEGPVNHPLEMASNWKQVTEKLQKDAGYPHSFAALYPGGMTAANIKDAIATFERSLNTPGSRFDQFLMGNANAITAQEREGFDLFQSYGCASCHQGVNLGGNMFEKMGLMGDYFADRGQMTDADKGRFNVTHDPHHLYQFRVPPLRNVARTAPYFHDGSAATLEQAISIMVRYQLGRPMPERDLKGVAAFLRSLNGSTNGSPL